MQTHTAPSLFLGLLWAALFSAAPALANPIHRLSQLDRTPRTLAEAGISGEPIVPASSFLLSDNLFIPTRIIRVGPSELLTEPRLITPQVGARFTSQGAGTDAFVGIEGFVPIAQELGQSLTYLEGRLQLSTERGTLGSNLLFGHRFLSDSKQQIMGGYLAYDRRNTGDAIFNQLGIGFESLSETFDARANVYLPFGNSSRSIGTSQIGGLSFRANELNIERLQAIQEALPGFDVEIGTRLFKLGQGAVRGYVGGYHYGGDRGSFTGFRSRLVIRPTDLVSAGVTLQTDSRFDTRLMFTVGMQFPGSGSTQASRPLTDSNITIKPNSKPDGNITIDIDSIRPLTLSKEGWNYVPPVIPKPSLLARLGESPDRQTSILVDQSVRRSVELAINPATGQPWRFQFVNLGVGTGDGTFEAPAGSVAGVLPTARSGGIVYVTAGTNPGIPGFRIPDGVAVISDAPQTTIVTQFGKLLLPNGGTGILPRITSTVTLGNDTVLAGFQIANSPGVGILGQNIRDVKIENNQITNTGSESIRLDNTTGTVTIRGNQINGTAPNTSLNQSPGILLSNTLGTTTATIADNSVANTSGTAIVVNATGTSDITATIERNRIDRPGFNGILGRAEGNGKLMAQIINNELTGSDSSLRAGIGIGARENGRTMGTVSGNQVSGFTNPDAEGIRVFAEGNSQTIATLIGNTLNNNRRGMFVTAGTTSKIQATIRDNRVTDNLEEGIFVTGGIEQNAVGIGTPQVAAIIDNNRIQNNRTSGNGYGDLVGMSFSTGTQVCLQLTNNQIGGLTLADTANPVLGVPFNTVPLSLLAGRVSLELPVTIANPGSNTIATVSPATSSLWSGTAIPVNTCRLP